MRYPNIAEIYDEVEACAHKDYVQNYLLENYELYIKDYLSITQKSNFSLAAIFDLNTLYLSQIYEILRTEKLNEASYALYQEGRGWTLIFQGRPFRGLRSGGFKYIKYLIDHKGETIHTNILDAILDSKRNINVGTQDPEHQFTNTSYAKDDTLIDYSCKNSIKSELQRLIVEINNCDDGLVEKELIEERNKILRLYNQAVDVKGKLREFSSPSIKSKLRIAKAIERAVKEIEKVEAKMGEETEISDHFRDALGALNSFDQCYNPRKDFDWKT